MVQQVRLEVSVHASAKDLVPDQVGQRQAGRHGRMPVSGNVMPANVTSTQATSVW